MAVKSPDIFEYPFFILRAVIPGRQVIRSVHRKDSRTLIKFSDIRQKIPKKSLLKEMEMID